jgi:hypothetical protein
MNGRYAHNNNPSESIRRRPLRRILIISTALAVLLGVGVAYAASSDFDTFSASETFSPSKAGSAAKPSPFAMGEHWTAKSNNSNNAAPLIHIVAKTYGVKVDTKDFPVCTDTMINNGGKTNPQKWDRVCPKGSLVAEGPVTSKLTDPNHPTAGGPCNPYLHVYNGGGNKVVFFFVSGPFSPNPAKYQCAGTTTGTSAPPYDGTISYKGGFAVTDIPLPPSVSTHAGGLPVYASLLTLDVVYKKLTKKVKGKTVAYQASVACKSGKRPYSFKFTAVNFPGLSPTSMTQTVSASAKC